MIVYSDRFLEHSQSGHPENKERLIRIMSLLEKEGIFKKVELREPLPASEEDILSVHSKRHLERMRSLPHGFGMIDADTYFNPHTYEAALLSAGGVITCLDSGREQCFSLGRPPGHHATKGSAMGFCIFNNAAVGAAYARKKGSRRVAILDFDLHHGNGTQDIFFSDDVLYISLHQWPHYPGTGSIEEIGRGAGEGYTVNIALPAGTADMSYRAALEEIVYPILNEHAPEVLIVSAGYDAHHSDPLGGLRLSTQIYREMAEKLRNIADRAIYTLEGGYNLDFLPLCVYSSISGLFQLDIEVDDTVQLEDPEVTGEVKKRVEKLKKVLGDHWSF